MGLRGESGARAVRRIPAGTLLVGPAGQSLLTPPSIAIRQRLDPRVLSQWGSHGVGLMHNPRHVFDCDLDPRFLSQWGSHGVNGAAREALTAGAVCHVRVHQERVQVPQVPARARGRAPAPSRAGCCTCSLTPPRKLLGFSSFSS